MLFVICAVIIALIGGVLVYRARNSNDTPASSSTAAENRETINYTPATDQEKADSQAIKDDIVQNDGQTTPAPTTANGKKGVTPVIATANYSRISAYVPGVIEDDGTCTATLTNTATAEKIIKTSQSIGNSTYTTCEPIAPGLTSGSWSITVSYNSAKAEGVSEKGKVDEKKE